MTIENRKRNADLRIKFALYASKSETPDLDEKFLTGFALDFAGNWREASNFSWHYAYEDDAAQWGIYYTVTRDSSLLEESNGAAIDKLLQPFIDSDSPNIMSESHNHWACGWIDGYAIKVYDDSGFTPEFLAIADIKRRLENYPILDEGDYSRREYDATIENIRDSYRIKRDHLRKNANDSWPYKVYRWLSDNGYDSELENRDDRGGYPSDESIIEALKALHLHGTGQ